MAVTTAYRDCSIAVTYLRMPTSHPTPAAPAMPPHSGWSKTIGAAAGLSRDDV